MAGTDIGAPFLSLHFLVLFSVLFFDHKLQSTAAMAASSLLFTGPSSLSRCLDLATTVSSNSHAHTAMRERGEKIGVWFALLSEPYEKSSSFGADQCVAGCCRL